MKASNLTKREAKAAHREIEKALKHLRKACELTGRNKIEVICEVSRAALRQPAPPASNVNMTPAALREMDLYCRADRLICCTLLDLAEWPPDETLTYATVGSGDNERFISPPRRLSTMLKPKQP